MLPLTYDGSAGWGRLYIDGEIQDMGQMDAIQTIDTLYLVPAQNSAAGRKPWMNCVYHRRLEEIEPEEAMEGTANSTTPDLDTGSLTKGWVQNHSDLNRRKELYFCGATLMPARACTHSRKNRCRWLLPDRIGRDGTGTTFGGADETFYKHRSTRLVRSEMDYDSIPNFPPNQNPPWNCGLVATDPTAFSACFPNAGTAGTSG